MALGDPPSYWPYDLSNIKPGDLLPLKNMADPHGLGIAGLLQQNVPQWGQQQAAQNLNTSGLNTAFSTQMQGASLIPTNPVVGDVVTMTFDGVKWTKIFGRDDPVPAQPQREIDTEFSLQEINAADDFIEEINAGRAA
jgi:hypothetical protein